MIGREFSLKAQIKAQSSLVEFSLETKLFINMKDLTETR